MFRFQSIAFLICLSFTGLMTVFGPAMAQTPPPARRPTPPTRDPHTAGYVTAKELPDGANAPADADGNFIIGPTHNPAPEMSVQEGVPQGTIYNFTMNSSDSKLYPGIAREPGTFGTAGALYAPRRCVCSQAICARNCRAVHCGCGRA
jgi:iron(III)-enterobactin esterase